MDVLELPFDQYQRYRLVSDLIEEVRAPGERLHILDVGGRTALLREFLPDDTVRLVDLEASKESGLVLGDGSRLPFRSDTFDVVCGFDTLEHVPPQRREAFVAECTRTSKRLVILAGPYRTPEVDEAEELLRGFMQDKLGLVHRYLEEHRGHGLPVRAEVEAHFQGHGARTRSFGHAGLERWLALMCMEMYMDADPGLRPIAARFFRFYNERLYASDHAQPVYRHAIVAALGDAALPEHARLDPPVAPPGAVAAMTGLTAELLAFDRELDVWKPEFARLTGELEALEKDLEGHRSRLADKSADLDEHKQNLADLERTYATSVEQAAQVEGTLRADLAEHERSLEEARGILETTRAEQAEVLRALEADLAEHQASLAQARADQAEYARQAEAQEAELRSEGDALRGHVSGLEGQLTETQAGAEAIQGELVAARKDIEHLVGELAHRDAELERLRLMLRDRVGNLKRAFGKKLEF